MRKSFFSRVATVIVFVMFALPFPEVHAGFPGAALATAPDFTQPPVGMVINTDPAIQDLKTRELQAEAADSQPQTAAIQPRLIFVNEEEGDYSNTTLRRFSARQQAAALQRRFGPLDRLRNSEAPGTESRTRATPVAGESDTAQGWSLWSDNSISHLKDTLPASASRGPSRSFTVGVDRAFDDVLTVGVSFNYLNTDLDTFFNNGTKRTDAYAASLYLHYQLLDWLAAELQGGYVHQRQKIRFNLAGGGLAKGKRKSHGYMVTASLNAARWFDRILLSARAGIIATRDRWNTLDAVDTATGIVAMTLDAQTERLVQGTAETGISYWIDPIMPYFTLTYTYDISRKTTSFATDRDDFTVTGGIAWYPPGELEGLALDISGSAVLGRKGQHNYTAAVGMKWSW